MSKEQIKQYIYIVQASNEATRCKIGKTKDLDRRLKEYNNMTGKSKDVIYQYLFACEVKDMTQVEKDIKEQYADFREDKSTEMYIINASMFKKYVQFIKSHPLFVAEIFIKTEDKPEVKVKIVKRTTPSLKEQGLSRKDVMQRAQKAEDDEFYTRYEDVEKELSMYDKSIWKDKVVLCNCDDAVDEDERKTSKFALYFLKNFKELDLKKLICIHYGGGTDIFSQGTKGYVYIYIFTKEGFKGTKEYPKNFTGSFDDPLSLKILNEEADIVCTNPPFSKAVDYWKILIRSGKKFIIISNISNAKNQPFMSYFKENKVWAGYNGVDKFENPKRQPVDAPGHWYTNIPINNRPKYKLLKIMPLKEIPEKIPEKIVKGKTIKEKMIKEYDDKGILIVTESYIPSDYKEPFAVSVRQILNGLLEKGYKYVQDKEYVPYIKGKRKFGRILVQKI